MSVLNGLAIATVLWCIPTLPVETCDVLEFNTYCSPHSSYYSRQSIRWVSERDPATGKRLWAAKCEYGIYDAPLTFDGEFWTCWDDDKTIRAREVIWSVTDFDPWSLRDFK